MLSRGKWVAIAIACALMGQALAEVNVAVTNRDIGGVPLDIRSRDAQQQTQIDRAITPVLQTLNAVFDELGQLNRQGGLQQPSMQLLELLALCDQWQSKTQNKFSCRLGGLQKDWQAAAVSGELPDRAALRQKARRHLQLQWSANRQVVRFSDSAKAEGLQVDLQGLWQGWVLEQLTPVINAVALNAPGEVSVAYGNLRVQFGKENSSEFIKQELEGLEPVTVALPKGHVLAVVDRLENLRKVGHHSLSRTLVPDEGWPVEFSPSLLVRATSAIEAGVMAQALLVVPGQQALADADRNTGVEVLTITETGKFFASREWYAKNPAEKGPWPEGMEFSVDFAIPALDVAEYRRPYIAIWISDAAEQPVHSLLVAGDSPRWLRELRQWWRKLGRGDDSLIDATTGATRKPGHYQLTWDGRDFQGRKVAAGNYVLHLEIAREHGEHESLVVPFMLDGKPLALKQQGRQELGVVTLTLR